MSKKTNNSVKPTTGVKFGSLPDLKPLSVTTDASTTVPNERSDIADLPKVLPHLENTINKSEEVTEQCRVLYELYHDQNEMKRKNEVHISELKAEIQRLQRRLDEAKEKEYEYFELKMKLQQHFYPISRRCLIEAARERIMEWFPDFEPSLSKFASGQWTDFLQYLEGKLDKGGNSSRSASIIDRDIRLIRLIEERQQYACGNPEGLTVVNREWTIKQSVMKLSRDALKEIFDHKTDSFIQLGNIAAHEVVTKHIRDAIIKTPDERKVPGLTEIFCVVFDKENFLD
ncbi:hypothetical protein CVT24_005282 [Panaeolus cyanescens]|uniref:Uncharacterized protein n=1 Tax=Panaeolus cyanescens TaxID=181874 RepID=A0A409Y9A7_9AGAR|nr:hypothetical protein CVT24_005282 [Panaeolus cyanescens]